MKEYLLAHDLGTSGNKATLFTIEGRLVKSITTSYNTEYSHNTWAEQNPENWWEAVCSSTHKLLEHIDNSKIAAIAFSGQMNGCLAVDKNGKPLYNHILYCDQRAKAEEKTLTEKLSTSYIFKTTGHRPNATNTAPKIMWLRNNHPEIYNNTYKFLQAKDYICYRLTDNMLTDYNDASSTNAFDLQTMKWSEKIIDKIDIDINKFPQAVPSATVAGEVTTKAAEATGLQKGTPVVIGAGDGGCATVGIGSIAPGITYNYLGSSSWISTTSLEPIDDPDMQTFTFAHPVKGYLQPCGAMLTGGSSYNWLKEVLACKETEEALKNDTSPYEIINKVIEKSPAGADGLLFLPYLLGERSPRWNPNAKGSFIGLKLKHNRADIFRSVLEGITMNLALILDVYKNNLEINSIRVMGGGAQGMVWRQIMADIYGIEVQIPEYLEEATSMGAAIIGGVATGVLDSFNDVERFIKITSITKPDSNNTALYNKKKELFNRAYSALDKSGIFPEI